MHACTCALSLYLAMNESIAALCRCELGKLLGSLRCTDRFSDVSKRAVPTVQSVDSSNSSTPSVSVAPVDDASLIIASVQTLQRNFSSIEEVMVPFLRAVVDPTLSGFVTAGALGSISLFLHQLPDLRSNLSVQQQVIDSVTRTKFTETDRDSDETVLMRIIDIVVTVLTNCEIDKSRVAQGLQCIQQIWISEVHSSSLRDSARIAVFEILTHIVQLPTGCDGYSRTLLENVSLNIELLVRQPPATFDADKLGFFLDVLGVVSRSETPHVVEWAAEMVPFQTVHALFHLLPPGSAAALVDGGSLGAITRTSAALPIVGYLVALNNELIVKMLAQNAFCAEALIVHTYIRPLAPVATDLGLFHSAGRKIAGGPTNGLYVSVIPAIPVLPQMHVTLMEGLLDLLNRVSARELCELFDGVWHRTEVGALLIDSVVNVALAGRCIALSPDAGLDKSLNAFQALAASPEAFLDRPLLIPSYVECLAMDVFLKMLESVNVGDSVGAHALVRIAARDVGKQIRAKPKKTGDLILGFMSEFAPDLPPHTNSCEEGIAKVLRLVGSIDFDSLGEFFGQPTDQSMGCLSNFIRSLNLPAMDPEEALRACLQSFRLPGEAQQIDRIVKEIAYEFYSSHSGTYFASADAAYTFLFSVIMLNTDQHNPQVKRRMELKDFIRNNRKINEGVDIPEEVQTRVFNNIRNSQIVTPKSSSLFCCPLKGRWKDLFYLNKTGYIPKTGRTSSLEIKGTEILLASAYVLSQDPHSHSNAAGVVSLLAEKGMNPAISVLLSYANESFAVATNNPVFSTRSFTCLKLLCGTTDTQHMGTLLSAYSPFSMLVETEPNIPDLPSRWGNILALPLLEVSAPAGIAGLFRGLLTPMYESELPAVDDGFGHLETPMSLFLGDAPADDGESANVVQEQAAKSWKAACLLWKDSAPSVGQISALQAAFSVGSNFDRFADGIVRKILEAESGSLRPGPWALLLVFRLDSTNLSIDLCRDAIIALLQKYKSAVADNGLKIVLVCIFGFVAKFSNLASFDPCWLLPILNELSQLDNLVVLGPVLSMSVRTMLMCAPAEWLSRVASPVWRDLFCLVARACPKNPIPRRVCHETAVILLLNTHFLTAVTSESMSECVLAYEAILQGERVAKSLSDLACKLSGVPGTTTGLAWTAIVSRIMFRISAVTKNKKAKGSDLSDCVELIRMCLGDPRAYRILTPVQAGVTVEKCASALSGIVSANTPPGALQAALSVFVRFFLTCLEKLQIHPQFDHLWLMSLRVILLFIKRGHDEPGMEQLGEVVTETLRNTLQVLLASNLLEFPNSQRENPPVWWKVTWEIVETFCPGMIDELVPLSESPEPRDTAEAFVLADSTDTPAEALTDSRDTPTEAPVPADTPAESPAETLVNSI